MKSLTFVQIMKWKFYVKRVFLEIFCNLNLPHIQYSSLHMHWIWNIWNWTGCAVTCLITCIVLTVYNHSLYWAIVVHFSNIIHKISGECTYFITDHRGSRCSTAKNGMMYVEHYTLHWASIHYFLGCDTSVDMTSPTHSPTSSPSLCHHPMKRWPHRRTATENWKLLVLTSALWLEKQPIAGTSFSICCDMSTGKPWPSSSSFMV